LPEVANFALALAEVLPRAGEQVKNPASRTGKNSLAGFAAAPAQSTTASTDNI